MILSFLFAFALVVTVGYTGATDNQKAFAYGVEYDVGSPDIACIDIENVAIITGESVYAGLISPVNVKPPISKQNHPEKIKAFDAAQHLLPEIRRLWENKSYSYRFKC